MPDSLPPTEHPATHRTAGQSGGGYLTPSLVSQAYQSVSAIKGLMTWSINWDGSRSWTFGDNVMALEGR
jgi:chitinase